ncbi:MAG TPA: YciI family protein [Puia sp.]|nr:YciI family protein [Puia sp.]
MKQYIATFFSCFLLVNYLPAQDSTKSKSAEGFQLKQYFFVMLTKGANRNQDSVAAAKIQEGHIENINRMAKLGKIIVAGPFGDDTNWRGIFIFDCKTADEVKEYLKTDPAIAAGRLNYEIHPWWTGKNCLFK